MSGLSLNATAPPKDFLSIRDLTRSDFLLLLDLAADMKAMRRLGRQAPTASVLAGEHVALLFEKPSLRTWTTFEIAVRELGGDTLHLAAEFADGLREPLRDVARNLERWVTALVVRTFGQNKAAELAAAAPCLHVINALTNEEHPCQALADMLTLREHWGNNCHGRVLAFVGDGNNVATSLVHAAPMLGISVHLASPRGYELPDATVEDAMAYARDGAQVRRFTDPRAAVADADAVYTDVWVSMGDEAEAEERKRVFAPYQVNASLMAAAGDALFMHCLPAHRGEEVTDQVIESPVSVVFDQAENRLHTQKALLALLLS